MTIVKKYLSKKHFFLALYIILAIFLLVKILLFKPLYYQKKYIYNYQEMPHIIQGKANIMDGDSIIINNNHIRLIGIDAPEISQKCYDGNDKLYKCGIESKKTLEKIINNKMVKCYYLTKDIYDRFLANCYMENININYKMIKTGMAIIYDKSSNNDKLIHQYEKYAKDNKIGIWQGYFMIPKNYRRYLAK